MATAALAGRRIRIAGTVQGVGFRPWVYRVATREGLTGRVRNDAGGVTIDAFGDEPSLARFIAALGTPPPAAVIERVEIADIDHEPARSFDIVASEDSREPRVSIPPDLAACDDCVAEIFDPANRRYRYPFTNCTHCGPRFTIATGIPYDRATTTMARFGMCPACRREYRDVGDRRFHAQPNACPICGPRLTLRANDGRVIDAPDVVAAAARAIVDGMIVAVKGLGGFHLACDATADAVVGELRRRKRRDEKPLAVMVANLEAAAALAVVDAEASRLLASPERPIVLVPKRDDAAIAASVAPGNRMLGLLLPYSPLHHLLLADAGRPLVMTSANLSDEPIAVDNREALARLGRVADLFVEHDRDIASRADDSVVAVIAGAGTVLRRSRGYVPRGIELTHASFVRPVLACGSLLKNTFCLGAGSAAWLGPHIGDLEHVGAYDAYVAAIPRLERFLRIQPEVIAHDLHPDYFSTRYAKERPEPTKIAVQHHHAHIVSAMAEHGIAGPAIGIAYDGAGYGTDGTMWGGEVMLATARAFRRIATFRPLRLVGGDAAVRSPWRLALALVHDAFDGAWPETLRERFAHVGTSDVAAVRRMLDGGIAMPLGRGVGRYFDAFGAFFLGRARASFEGQAALEWNQAADPAVTRAYPFDVSTIRTVDGAAEIDVLEIDLRPAVRAAIGDAADHAGVDSIAAAFHNTIAAATYAVASRATASLAPMPVVASGGCFQNALLAERVRAAFAPGQTVLFQRRVPPGDGGIALGQAVVANAMTSEC
jgi:hydrogenase maturation protein HypF